MKRPTKQAPALYLSRLPATEGGEYLLARAPGNAQLYLDAMDDCAMATVAAQNGNHDEAAELHRSGVALTHKHYAKYVMRFCPTKFHLATDIRLALNERDVKVRISFKVVR